MTVGNVASLHTQDRAGHARFGHVLRAEWTKFRTVRGWVVGTVVAALVTVLFGVLSALASHSHCFAPPGQGLPRSGVDNAPF